MDKNNTMTTGMKIKRTFQKHTQLAALMVLIVASIFFALLSPLTKDGVSAFVTPMNIANVIEQTAAISVLAFGMTMILLTGGIDLSVGAIIGLTNIVGCTLMQNLGWGILPSILVMIVIGLGAGALNGFLIVQFKVQPFLITMSTMTIFRGIVYAISRGESIYLTDTTFSMIFVRGTLLGLPVTLYWTILFLVIMYIVASKSKFGRNVQAVGGNEVAARNSGVNVTMTKIGTYMISGVLATVAGLITLGRLSSASSMTGTGAEMNAIAAAVIGGTSFSGDGGNMIGTLLGSLVMGVFVNGLTIMGVDSFYQDIIKGVIIIVAVITSNLLISTQRKA